jgi:hypothetical protein
LRAGDKLLGGRFVIALCKLLEWRFSHFANFRSFGTTVERWFNAFSAASVLLKSGEQNNFLKRDCRL